MSLGHASTIETNQGYVDKNNSSTTNLTAATTLTFTGKWFDATDYSELTVLINTNQAGTLLIQSSMDTTVHASGYVQHRLAERQTSVLPVLAAVRGVPQRPVRQVCSLPG